jgi:alpha-L-fucosidase
MKRREVLKAGAACAAAAALGPVATANSVFGKPAAQIPSYLRGYEATYATDPRKAAVEYFREAKFGLFLHYGLYSLLEG